MIDAEALAVLQEMQRGQRPIPVDQAEWLAGYRAQLAGLGKWQGPGPDVPATAVTVPGGGTLRLLRPAPGDRRWPTVLFIHGGGFVAGSMDAYETPLRWLALRSGWQVAALDYRLAPEHPYPAAPDDGLAALRYLSAAPFVDRGRLAVAGDSAGGLLAAVVAMRARTAGIALCQQILLYPNTDLRPDAPYASRVAFDGTVVRLEELYRSLALYAGDTPRTDPELSPVLAADLAGLPPAMVVTNACDPLRDEGEALAARLGAAGVPVTHWRVPGMIHGALQYAGAVSAGDALISAVAKHLAGL